MFDHLWSRILKKLLCQFCIPVVIIFWIATDSHAQSDVSFSSVFSSAFPTVMVSMILNKINNPSMEEFLVDQRQYPAFRGKYFYSEDQSSGLIESETVPMDGNGQAGFNYDTLFQLVSEALGVLEPRGSAESDPALVAEVTGGAWQSYQSAMEADGEDTLNRIRQDRWRAITADLFTENQEGARRTWLLEALLELSGVDLDYRIDTTQVTSSMRQVYGVGYQSQGRLAVGLANNGVGQEADDGRPLSYDDRRRKGETGPTFNALPTSGDGQTPTVTSGSQGDST